MITSKPSEPGDEHDEHKRDGKTDDDLDESRDFLLELGRLVLVLVGELVDAAHNGALAGKDDDTGGATVADMSTEEGNVLGLEEVGLGGLDGTGDLFRFTRENGSIKLEIGGGLDDSHVGRHLVTGRENTDITDDEISGRDGPVLTVTDDDGVLGQKVKNRVHDLLCRPILKSVEEGLEEDDDQDDDGKRKVVSLGRVTERLPRDEEDNDTDPENRAESTKSVVEELEPVLVLLLRQDILAVALETTSGGGAVETGGRVDVESLGKRIRFDGVEVERTEKVSIGKLSLALFGGFDTLRLVDLNA